MTSDEGERWKDLALLLRAMLDKAHTRIAQLWILVAFLGLGILGSIMKWWRL